MAELACVFSSHMVFAKGKPILIYGRGQSPVTVTFAEQTRTAAPEQGRWEVQLPPMPAGGPYTMTVSDRDGTRTLEDLYVGEVYLMAGQSNMQLPLSGTNTPREAYCTDHRLRLFVTDRLEPGEAFRSGDGWRCAEAEEAAGWSALAYLTGREILAKKPELAVGMIACYQGASVIEAWMPKGTCSRLGIHIPENELFYDHTCETYRAWNQEGKLCETQLSRIVPFPVSGVVWYQGESDASPAEGRVYRQELAELIRTWREAFRDETLPFYVIQLADFPERSRNDEGWSLIQQAQAEIPSFASRTETIVCRDICEDSEIHPPTKTLLAKRIASALLKNM